MTSKSSGDTDLKSPIIVWFRQDLRLCDNPALCNAVETGRPVIALYIHDEVSENLRLMGAAQKWWLHYSLKSLDADLQTLGTRLILKSGPAVEVLQEVQQRSDAQALYWNRRYGAGEQSVDKAVKSGFEGEAKSFAGILMHEPSMVRTGGGKPYKVYTPFWRNFIAAPPPRLPLKKPEKLTDGSSNVTSLSVDDYGFLPTMPDWSGGIDEEWVPGEQGAADRLKQFLNGNIDVYDEARDLPGPDRTSKLSPHLRFGEVSPFQLWYASFSRASNMSDKAREIWRKELVWREFCYHLLQEWPSLAESNFNPKFDIFPWGENQIYFDAWKKGQTGYPIVDAGMRQLWQTGWMHNRVRMIVASFLVKHLLIDWRKGEQWFWDTLVDGDPASNPAQWQWVAGSGADASPYFRIFNPILQSEKFDGSGEYIKRYVPELANLPDKHFAAPWDAPIDILNKAGVELGKSYPHPIVDHKEARNKALAALQSTRPPPED